MHCGSKYYPKLFLLSQALLVVTLIVVSIQFGNEEFLLFGHGFEVNETLWILTLFSMLTLASGFFFVIALSYEDPYDVARRESGNHGKHGNPLVSFLVAVRNDERSIVDCVDSMLAQTYPNREIFIVDDASEDGTARVLKERYGKVSEVTLLGCERNRGKKGALAKALAIAGGDILAFTDSDSVWEPDAIERVVAIFEHDPDVGAISGHCNATNADINALTRMQDAWNEKQYRLRKGFESVFGAVSCVSGPLACYRRAAVYNYIPAWENDRFLGQRFRFATDRTMTGFVLGGAKLGPELKARYPESHFVQNEDHPARNWKVVYSNSARARTMVPDTRQKLVTQRIRWGKSFIRNLFLTGRFYWRRPMLPALYFYLNIIYVFALPVIIAAIPVWLCLNGHWQPLALYLALFGSICLVSGAAIRIENERLARWVGRPLLSLFGLIALPWLLLYSVITIRNMTWQRDIPAEA